MAQQLMISKSKMPGSSYFFYRTASFSMENCNAMYVGSESLFENFSKTLRDVEHLPNSLACLVFVDNSELEILVNEMELFIKNTSQELKVFVDSINDILIDLKDDDP